MATDTAVTVEIQCLCKANKFSTRVPVSSLPFDASFCHCTSCRHVTGGVFACFSVWPGDIEEVLNSSLKSYQYTKDSSLKSCGTCSSFLFGHIKKNPDPNHPGLLVFHVGMLPNTVAGLPADVPLVKFSDQYHVGDTVDGGASVFLQRPNGDGKAIERWQGYIGVSEAVPEDWPPKNLLAEAASRPRLEEVPVRCHCRGVDFVMRRGDEEFAKMKTAGTLPGWVDPDSLKQIAAFDACDSCRFQFGAPIMNWTFALLKQLHFASSGSGDSAFPNSTLDLKAAVTSGKDSRLGTLAFYESSPEVQRYFCSKCSASVFYAADDLPAQVDVAIGLLDAPEGARAGSWLEWEFGSMGHYKDAVGGWREKFADAVKQCAVEWRDSRGIQKAHRIRAKEQK